MNRAKPPAWTTEAACARLDPAEADALFLGGNLLSGRRICRAECPVVDQCRALADTFEVGSRGSLANMLGVWGGELPHERVKRRNQAALDQAAEGAAS